MDFIDWIPALSTTSLLALALWLSRSLIITRLTKSVQHEFDEKIETLRTNLRKSEESFKADLRTKETQIEVLRSGAISGLISRQAALDKRRIDAVDQLWSEVIALGPAKAATAYIAAINFEVAVQEASKNPKVREMFSMLAIDPQKFQSTDASKARPFMSQMAWALFSAYRAALLSSVLKLQMLKIGVEIPKAIDTDAVSKLIKIALPHHADYIEKYGAGGYHYLLDELETRLLEELQKILQGVEADKASVEQAAVIIKESERFMESISKTATTSKV